MHTAQNTKNFFTACQECYGFGKKKRRIKKSLKLRYQLELDNYNKSNGKVLCPTSPEAHFYICPKCLGSGLILSEKKLLPDTIHLPKVAIIGGGIGGVALGVACLHRGIPFTIYERDNSFDERSQGYGLTLQQASKALAGFGISYLDQGIVSTRHLVHTTDGQVVAEWGMRKWLTDFEKKKPKKTNIHIARQALRSALIEQLGGKENIQWGHQLIDFKENKEGTIDLHFNVNNEVKTKIADIIVGADGIRSSVRKQVIGEKKSPMCYLGCIVILGICSIETLADKNHQLLDGETVFQTANGNDRIYIMPYDKDSVMWQLSFPISEEKAKTLSLKGSEALKQEAIKRTNWHTPVPQIVEATLATHISGYPVYDRAILTKELLKNEKKVTLIGDAAHPMSPFKGQGANQALLDALSLARIISKNCNSQSHWQQLGIKELVLNEFEDEMIARSSVKVEDSAAAASFLHSEIALYEGNEPRGKILKRNN